MTQTVKDYFRQVAKEKAAAAKAISDGANAEGRGMTDDERDKASALIDEANEHRRKAEDLDTNDKFTAQIEDMVGKMVGSPEQAPDYVRSIGEAFTKSDGYKALIAGFKSASLGGRWTTGPVELPGWGSKANVTETLSPIIQPSVVPGISQAAAVALRELTVADLLMQGTTNSNTVRYLQETTNTNAAAPVLEAGDKPESSITFTQTDEPVRKVATFLPVSDEMLEDEAQIRSYLENRLRLFVMHAEEDQLLNGSGTAPAIRGLLNRVGIQTGTRSALGVTTGETAGSTSIANAVHAAITAIRTSALVEPDGIVMHPNNWQAFKLAKDANGQYYGGGPFVGPYGVNGIAGEEAWGLRVVVTSRIAANTALVGAFGTMAQVFYRGGLTVEASNSHSDYFIKNLTALRAERRLALAVYRPSAFHAITALQTA